MAAIKALQQWCKVQCDGYRDVDIINMTTSFRDGLAFCALIHRFRPDLINFESLSKDNVYDNNCLAFRVAEDYLGIPALLDAEDMVALPVPDRLSILTYVSQYYNYFSGRTSMGGVGGVKRPAEDSKEEPSEKKNLPVTAKSYSPKTHPVSSSPGSCKAAQDHSPSLFTQSCSKHVSATPIQQCAMEKQPISKNTKMASLNTGLASTVKSPGSNTEKTVLVESSNKTGTLNSKCAVCRSHVHLVQRHLVDGKLYHRGCFKCSECSAVLQSGAYTSGQQPGTLLCSSNHCTQNGLKSSAKHNGSDATGLEPETGNGPSSWQHFSILTSPVLPVPRSVLPTSPPEPWTASALRTQAARQKFFLSAQNLNVSKSGEEKESARALISQKLAEGNCNNNNKAYGCRLGPDNKSVEVLSSEQERCGLDRDVKSAHFGISPTNTSNMESRWLSGINKEHTKPPSSSLFIARAKDVDRCEGPKLKMDSNEPRLKTFAEDEAVTWEENKAICNDNQLSHQYTSSVPGFQSTNIVHPSKLYTPKSPAADSAALGAKSERSSVSSSPRCTVPCTEQHHGGLAESSCISGNYKSCPSLQPLVDDSISLRPSAIQPRYSGTAEHAENESVPLENSSQPETEPLAIKSRHIPAEQITKELQEIESSLSDLEKVGIELERQLRSYEEEGSGDILLDPLMVDWFNLIRKKQSYIRRESELVYIARTQDLEEQQPGVEGELRRLINKPEHLKSTTERKRESELMKRLLEIVNDRNAIVDGLEEDRRREEEEDQQLNEMMHRLGLRKVKSRRTSSFSKLFRRKSKNERRKDE